MNIGQVQVVQAHKTCYTVGRKAQTGRFNAETSLVWALLFIYKEYGKNIIIVVLSI